MLTGVKMVRSKPPLTIREPFRIRGAPAFLDGSVPIYGLEVSIGRRLHCEIEPFEHALCMINYCFHVREIGKTVSYMYKVSLTCTMRHIESELYNHPSVPPLKCKG
jgi:hypothetical protein